MLAMAQHETTRDGRDNEHTCIFFSILKDGTMVIRRFDVTRRQWIGMPWTVKPAEGKAGFKYTDAKRSKVALWWENGAKASTSKLDETSATVGVIVIAGAALVAGGIAYHKRHQAWPALPAHRQAMRQERQH